ncbi:hypothetical protein [Pontibacter akesuensis]|uniref:Outer membrane protein beta-barrel domain-containing protein n=1 Tax=Pontibacter akesuensis TaxID=388950 RepID=A0A1I7FGM1_9BACT|nr:hypothetical protein [Pontibacter akesuensis]GHA62252.1 hypothetical protein GCM10007389_13680 [Pontibacter akesuensis]SFU35363.1 hypothetical protein SAMN04487941_0188 [Pontibacter akesuensis]
MKKKVYFLLAFLLAHISVSYAQGPDNYRTGLTTGYSYANSHFLQLGIIYGKNYGNVHIPALGYGIGADVGLVEEKLAVGAKGFIEYNPFILTVTRLGVIHYTSQGQNDFRILPEAGISIFGLIHFTYGYSIPLSRREIVDIGKNRLSLSVNIFRED